MAGRYDLGALNAQPANEATPVERKFLRLLASSGWDVRSGRAWVFTDNNMLHVLLKIASGTVVIVPCRDAFVPIYHTDHDGFSRTLAGLRPGLTPQEFEEVIAW
ncbi:MAG: hypothetical protein PVI21_00820 [Candidatus Woesebacteria bacterium]|jgi:hypothetical protein